LVKVNSFIGIEHLYVDGVFLGFHTLIFLLIYWPYGTCME